MKEQMEMFEEGGLADEGGTKDPVSGNDVPVGSTQKEVRDDIPAQLSEGEFVLPADVVRFHGLEKIMALRDEAKRGLAKMEAMGQMSNADEATLDDDVPFSIEDLDMEEDNDYNFNQGGVVQPQGFTGIQTSQPSQFQNYQGQYVQYQQPSIPQAASQQFVQPAYMPPQQQVVPTMQQQQLPEFKDFISTPTGAYDELREYRNPTTGEVRKIPFVGGQPIYPIPEGFIYVDPEATTTEEVTTTPTTTGTTKVTEQPDGGDGDSADGPTGAIASLGGTLNPDGTVSGSTQFNMSYDIPGTLPGILGTALGVAQLATSGLPENGLAKISKPTNPDLVFALTPKHANGTVVGKGKSVTSEKSQEILDLYNKLEENGITGQYGVDAAESLSDAIDEGMLGSETGKGSGPTSRGFGGTGRGRSDVDVTPSATAAGVQAQQQDDNDDDNSNQSSGTSVSEISGVSSGGGGYSAPGGYGGVGSSAAAGGSDPFGGNDMIAHGGYIHEGRKPSVKKQMEKSGLTPKK